MKINDGVFTDASAACDVLCDRAGGHTGAALCSCPHPVPAPAVAGIC